MESDAGGRADDGAFRVAEDSGVVAGGAVIGAVDAEVGDGEELRLVDQGAAVLAEVADAGRVVISPF